MQTLKIPLKDILVDFSFNCRRQEIVPADVFDLMEDIKVHGLLQPVLVKPIEHKKYKYKLFAGFRRFASFRYLGLDEIPAVVHDSLSEEDCMAINLSENLKRSELNIQQEAWGVYNFYALGKSIDYIASRLDVSREWVKVRILLLQLPDDIQQEAANGTLNQKNIKELVPLYEKDPKKAYKAVADIRDKKNKLKIKEKKPQEIKHRKLRKFDEIFEIQDLLIEAFYTNLASRAIAWTICELSTAEFMAFVKEETKLMGLEWAIPVKYNDPEYQNDKVKT